LEISVFLLAHYTPCSIHVVPGMAAVCKFGYMLMTSTMVVIDYRVLQQFAKETVQGGSDPVSVSSAKTTSDDSLVGVVKFTS